MIAWKEIFGPCADRCGNCPTLDHAASGTPDALEGPRLVVASALVFLLPLLVALAGAWWGHEGLRQVGGAVAGFGAGLAVAVTIARRFFRPK